MTAITVANLDWEIIDDLDEALAGATISSSTVFKQVTAVAKRPQFAEAQMRGSTPIASIVYIGTSEDENPEGLRGCAVDVEIVVATKGTAKLDDAARLQEALRLINAAKNAVEASPPSDAHYWGDANNWRDKLEWGTPEIEPDAEDPWIIATVPLSVSYSLASSTSH